jgi:hypothetical protein
MMWSAIVSIAPIGRDGQAPGEPFLREPERW